MGKESTNEYGRINIADDVIAVVAGIAAMECYGLVGMAARNLQDGLAELLGMEHLRRGIDVQIEPDGVILDLYVIVEYGTKISEVARNAMEKVKYTVESMLGLDVKQVNVHVQGVRVTNTKPVPAAR
ncbi:MAG: Asp23/Gls24 family envelope stress response protein [Firmicutes bacterium]|nr:Asp23/Gls24 family envelope stress response protein [Bacillota bacterium]